MNAAIDLETEVPLALAEGPVRVSTVPESPAVPILRSLLLGALFLAPFSFGAVQVWAWAALAVVSSLLVAAWAIMSARLPAVRLVWSPLFFPAAAFALLGLIQLFGHLTADATGTREALLKFATGLAVFILAAQLWRGGDERTQERWQGFGLMVTLYSFLLSLFAILQFFSGRGEIFWTVKTGGWSFGPYVNHNHYAGLMEMLIPISVFYAVSRRRKSRQRWLLGFAVLFPIASVLLSGSRGGCMVMVGELFVIALVAARCRSRGGRLRFAVAGLASAAGVVALVAWLATGDLARRLESLGDLPHVPEAVLGDRLELARDTFSLFQKNAAFGTGLGAFSSVFPQAQTFPSAYVNDHAHNDFLEALAETGAAGGFLILAALFLGARRAWGNLTARLGDESCWLPFAASLGCLGLLIHGLGDFNLHIPANAAWFAFLLGVSESSNLCDPSGIGLHRTCSTARWPSLPE